MHIRKRILCVDDDVDDLFLILSAIQDIQPDYEVIQLQNGVEAIDYLSDAKRNNQLPDLVLLDINMPLLDGKQTLEKIRAGLALEELPVIIFSASQNPNDVALFKSKGVAMHSKPNDYPAFKDLVQTFLLQCV